MKNLSKILCAVLVLAMLCSSLIFMVGAEEEEATPAYTSVEATFAEMLKLNYNAEDNLIISITRPTNTANGWNGEGARQAHIVTNTATGESWYREWFEGDAFLLKDGGEPANVGGNEYIQYNFTKQTLTYEEGYHEYIVVDMDLAYKAKTATIWDKTKYVSTSYMKQEVIGRGSAGTSWSTVQNYKDFGLGDGFKHVTTVYDYTGGNAYVFVNGTLAATYANGALTAAVKNAYLSGTAVEVSEWRIGSNSADEMHIANPYVRYTKMANAEDTLATAISSGKISTWGGNIYDADYVVPTPYWFVKSADHTEVENYINQINTTTAIALDTSVAGNLYVGNGQSTSIGNGVDILGAKQTVADDLTYVTFYAKNDGNIEKKNVFWQFNTLNAPNVSIKSDSTAYYVVDLDIATHGEVLPYIDVSVMLRRVSDGGGFPFSPNVNVAPYINPNSEWNHVTIVGDLGANKCYVYVNGEYAETLDYAYKASEISGNTELSPKGIRVDLGLSAETHAVKAGQNIAFDNFAERVYTDAASSNGLAAAVAAGNLNTWANHTNGNAGRALPVIATVNGVEYYNANKLATALISNYKLEVEYFSVPFTPAVLQANATVKTNGFDKASLFTLSSSCEILSEEDGVLKTYAPFAENRDANQVTIPGGVNIPSVYNAIKYNVSGNLLTSFTPISLQKDGKYQPTWGSAGFRNGELVTNLDTGDVFYRESAILLPDGTMADGWVVDGDGNVVSYKEADKGGNTFIRSNEYVNMTFTSTNLQYEAGKNEYIVVDFDFGTDDFIDEVIALQIIPRVSGSGAWASDIYLSTLPVEPGTMAHITLVFDYSTNNAHVFVNGAFAYTVAEGAMDGDKSGGRTDGSKWADKYMQGEAFNVAEFKLASDRKTGTVCFDNMAIRFYDLAASDDVIGAAVAAGDITTWADSIYNDKYVTSKFPAVASVDGVDYGTVDALNAALAVETDAVKNVYFKHTFTGTLFIKNETTVETNGLPVDFNYETGLYKFHHDDPYYVCTGTDYAYASNRLIKAHEEGSTVYKFEDINQDNAATHATPIVWFYSLEPEQVEVVFYVHGDQIEPLQNKAYIEDGKLMKDVWTYMDQDFVVGEVAESFPVASKALSETWYLHSATTTDADFAASDIKQQANVSANVQFTVYVNADQTITDGEVTNLDGQDYVTYTFEFAPHDFDKNFTVEFLVEDENGTQYVQKQNVSFLGYAEQLLETSTGMQKDLVVALLNYANEANKLFEGEGVAKAEELIAANTPVVATPSTVYNTDDLSAVIRSAAMKLNSTPEFLFKVARGFKGTLTFTYTGINGAKSYTTDPIDATEMEQLVALNNFAVADIFEDITITATYENGATVTGKYNLSTYANGLDNPAFANALLAYAQASKVLVENQPRPIFGEDGKVIKYEILTKEKVANENLKAVVTNKIKQWDQSDAHNVHTGTPEYVKVIRDNRLVEALYFSKTTPWLGDEGEQFSEYRLAVNGEQAGPAVTSFSFWYLAKGTVDENKGTGNGGYTFKDLEGKEFVADAYVQIKTPSNHPLAGDNYPELSGTDFQLDGEWHYRTITFEEPIVIIDILFNLYHFQGEFLISDLVINYAE